MNLNDKTKLSIIISGREFQMSRQCLLQYPETRLGRTVNVSNMSNTLVYERPIVHFKSVLSFYQTGKLHMPRHVCPREFCDELHFWGFNPQQLERCCLLRYLEFQNDDEQTQIFQKVLNTTTSSPSGHKGMHTLKNRIWSIIDHREATLIARAYLVLGLLFVCLSLASLSLSTLPQLQKPISVCELKDYITVTGDHSNDTVIIKEFLENANIDCQDTPQEALKRYMKKWYDADEEDIRNEIYNWNNTEMDEDDFLIYDLHLFIKLKKVEIPMIFHRSDVFYFIDIILLIFFSLELFVRLITCPSFFEYFRSFLNDIDILALVSSFLGFVLEEILVKYKYDHQSIHILGYLRICRVFRLLRVVQHIAAIQVLAHCLRNNYKDLLVLLLYVFIGINIYGIAMFFLESRETFDSIPLAWYWAVITMTTVGYGDLYPKSFGGKVVATFCALTGVLVLALVIPVFVNNFIFLYRIVDFNEKEKELKQSKPKKNCKYKVVPL